VQCQFLTMILDLIGTCFLVWEFRFDIILVLHYLLLDYDAFLLDPFSNLVYCFI
jgi:hypothetical protein